MKNILSKFKFAILIVVIVFAVLLVTKNALAAGLCSGTGCRGKDPINQQCYTVSTIAYAYYPDDSTWKIYTELRKSADCNSLWSRATKAASYSGNWMLSEALECTNNDCIYTSSTPPPNPSTYYYYYPNNGNKQTPAPGQSPNWYSDMVSGTKNACARGWVYTSNISGYVTSPSVWKSWACNNPGGPG